MFCISDLYDQKRIDQQDTGQPNQQEFNTQFMRIRHRSDAEKGGQRCREEQSQRPRFFKEVPGQKEEAD